MLGCDGIWEGSCDEGKSVVEFLADQLTQNKTKIDKGVAIRNLLKNLMASNFGSQNLGSKIKN